MCLIFCPYLRYSHDLRNTISSGYLLVKVCLGRTLNWLERRPRPTANTSSTTKSQGTSVALLLAPRSYLG